MMMMIGATREESTAWVSEGAPCWPVGRWECVKTSRPIFQTRPPPRWRDPEYTNASLHAPWSPSPSTKLCRAAVDGWSLCTVTNKGLTKIRNSQKMCPRVAFRLRYIASWDLSQDWVAPAVHKSIPEFQCETLSNHRFKMSLRLKFCLSKKQSMAGWRMTV